MSIHVLIATFTVLLAATGCGSPQVNLGGVDVKLIEEPTTLPADGVTDGETRLFVTRTMVIGGQLGGGPQVADAICASEAKNSGLIREYRALLRSDTRDFLSIVHPNRALYSVRKTIGGATTRDLLAGSGTKLFSEAFGYRRPAALSHADGNGADSAYYESLAWTGFAVDGTAAENCANWSNIFTRGNAGYYPSPAEWISTNEYGCDRFAALYCVSQ